MRRRSFSLTSPANGCALRSRCPSSDSSRRTPADLAPGPFQQFLPLLPAPRQCFPANSTPPLQVLVCDLEKAGVRVDLLDDQLGHLETSAVDMRMSFSDDGVPQLVPPSAGCAVGPRPGWSATSVASCRFAGDIDHGPVLGRPSSGASMDGCTPATPTILHSPTSDLGNLAHPRPGTTAAVRWLCPHRHHLRHIPNASKFFRIARRQGRPPPHRAPPAPHESPASPPRSRNPRPPPPARPPRSDPGSGSSRWPRSRHGPPA